MSTFNGYSIDQRLHRSPRHMIYRGRRSWDGQPVILKCPTARFPSRQDLIRLRRDYDFLCRLKGDGAPRPFALEQHDQGLVLICEDNGADALTALIEKGPLPAKDFIPVALACCDALAKVHGEGILHKDISPGNIILTSAGKAKLIDFADSADLSTPQAASDSQPLVGTAAYISPEQTGRVRRNLDHRSDYYALGATFYELLTGRPPFHGEDTLEILLAHLGRPPEPPHSQIAEIPESLSLLVVKLLAKSPEERYQSLSGLRTDLLACQAAMEQGGPGKAILLGAKDHSHIFRLSQRLYGRGAEIERIEEILCRQRANQPEVIVIEGPSGVGKTALIGEFASRNHARRGCHILGRFEEFRRTTPYAAIRDAVSHHLRSLLSGSEEELRRTARRLEKALAGQGAALTSALPDLELIIGHQPAVPQLAPAETENRFLRAFRAMIGAIHKDEQPLALILDDLQWADRSSLHLIQHLLSPINAGRGLVLIATTRSDLPEAVEGLKFFFDRLANNRIPLHRLAVGPLSVESVTDWLRESLGEWKADLSPLAVLCHQKTSGNPFFLTRFVTSLQEQGLISFDPASERWGWSLQEIAQLDMTDNVVDLMIEKLSQLSPAGHRVLQRAACIGQTFDLETLAYINDVGPQATLQQLQESLRQGLILPLSDDYDQILLEDHQGNPPSSGPPLLFRFLHDRVHQAAYSQIPPSERGLRHLNIGRTLLERYDQDGDLAGGVFAIVDQFNRGRAHLREAPLQHRVAELNRDAARKAHSSGASAAALSYALEGIDCLGASGWHSDHDLCLTLHNQAIDAALRSGERATMEALCAEVRHHAYDALERSVAVEATVSSFSVANQLNKAIDLFLQHLEALGFPLPRNPGALRRAVATWQCRWAFSRIRSGRTAPRRLASEEAQAAIRLLRTILPPLVFSAPSLVPAATARLLTLAERHGDDDCLAYALSRYVVLQATHNRVQTAIQAASLALELCEPLPLTASTIRTRFGALFHGLHWTTSLREMRSEMEVMLNAGLNDGDPEKLGYVTGGFLACGFHAGIDLEMLRNDVTQSSNMIQHLNSNWLQPYASCLLQAIENLTTPCADPTSLNGRYHNDLAANQALLKGRNFLLLNGALAVKMTLCCIFDRYDEARSAATMIEQHAQVSASTLLAASHCFLESLAWSRDPSAGALPGRLKVLRRALRRLRRWESLGGDSITHRVLLLSAEEARLEGRTLRAAEFYDQAIKAAHSAGFTHEEAMANEYAASFHEQRGRPMIAEAYRRQAHYRWRLWGALRKAAAMEEEWPDLARAEDDPAASFLGQSSSGRHDGSGVDLAAVMKAAQAISGEIHRPALLENLLRITMSTAGAQRGLVFLRASAGWTLEAAGESTADRITLLRTPVLVNDRGTALAPSRPHADERSWAQRTPATRRPEGEEAAENPTAPETAQNPTAQSPVAQSPVAFSRSAFNYAVRTREALVLNDAANEGAFSDDPYISQRKTRSLLCLPLFQQADLRGMLYLENDLTTGAFTGDRLEVLRLLAAQVIVSLDNAVLYENLTNLNRTLEAEVAERTREATEKSHLLETTLDHMSDGLVVYNAQDELILWNDRAAALFGLEADSVHMGATQTDIARASADTGALAPRLTDLVHRRLADGAPPFPDRATSEIELADGRFVQMRRTPLPDGGQVQVFLDVSDERRRERELMLAHKAAEKALRNLQNAQESLIQAEKMASLGQLVAGVAHEINTPVGITLTAASFLGERAQAMRNALESSGIRKSQLVQFIDQADETTTLMMNNIQRAADLIQSFKQVAVDQTSGERRSVELKRYFQEVLRSFSPMLKKTAHAISLDCPEDLTVESFPGVLTQILTNLIMNSVTHAFPDGRSGEMRIAVSYLPHSKMVELIYRDDGIGIPKAHTSRVFDPFFTTRRGSGGSGLGLNIVYNLVTGLLGGTISLRSSEGEGCAFTILFPAHPPEQAEEQTPNPQPAEPPATTHL